MTMKVNDKQEEVLDTEQMNQGPEGGGGEIKWTTSLNKKRMEAVDKPTAPSMVGEQDVRNINPADIGAKAREPGKSYMQRGDNEGTNTGTFGRGPVGGNTPTAK